MGEILQCGDCPRHPLCEGMELDAFRRQHLAAAEVQAANHRPEASRFGEPGRGAGVFSPGGGLSCLCFGDSMSLISRVQSLLLLAQSLLLCVYSAAVFLCLTEIPRVFQQNALGPQGSKAG